MILIGDGGRGADSPSNIHVPVLLHEVIAWLDVAPGRCYIDATVGLGGHAESILERSAPNGRLLGIDQDPDALGAARQRLALFGDRAVLAQAPHTELQNLARAVGFDRVDGALFDLGVSSLQLDDPTRGFSFRERGPLDMRMNPDQDLTAEEMLNTWPEHELARIIYEYGEERHARRIAREITRRRPLHDTQELAELVRRVVRHSGRIHPATRTFQALRIAVNGELESLREVLPQAVQLLKPGGRLAVVSFHSLEDRIVKQFIRRETQGCICSPQAPGCTCEHVATLRGLSKKPITATDEEVARNPRSRSAKLRVAVKLEAPCREISDAASVLP